MILDKNNQITDKQNHQIILKLIIAKRERKRNRNRKNSQTKKIL